MTAKESQHWLEYVGERAFELFVAGKGVTIPKQMKGLVLHCRGIDLQAIYLTLPAAPEPGEGETVFTSAMNQLEQHFTPQVIPYERQLFRSMQQLSTESINL